MTVASKVSILSGALKNTDAWVLVPRDSNLIVSTHGFGFLKLLR
jgi:hypothetical protein